MRYGVEKFRAGTRERGRRVGPGRRRTRLPRLTSGRTGTANRRTGTAVPNVRHLGDV
jgi:hypothetical protein